jgi:hypothetical protein
MLKLLPPRLRASVYIIVVGAIAIGVAIPVYGWVTVWVVGPFVLVVAGWIIYRDHPDAGEQQVGH